MPDFLKRVAKVKQASSEKQIPPAHLEWVRAHLNELFGFYPESLPTYYSNHKLMPWQAAVTWIEPGSSPIVQMREGLKKGSYLGIYSREEILSHEAVHAFRSAFKDDRWEEYFAYMTSEKQWRKVLGPIVKNPWEIWPFLIFCLGGLFFPEAYFGAALWAIMGFWRLSIGHRTLAKAAKSLMKKMHDVSSVRGTLVRLTDKEIKDLAKDKPIGDHSLRWRVIRLAYFKGGTE